MVMAANAALLRRFTGRYRTSFTAYFPWRLGHIGILSDDE